MKNKRMKRLIRAFIIFVITLFTINLVCHIRLMGEYYTSYYGEVTNYKFKYSKYISQNALYKFKVYFNKIHIFGELYDYSIKDDKLCLSSKKEIYKCYYKTKKKAYEEDSFYEISNAYFKTLADKAGYYKSDNKLYAYYGLDKEIVIPNSIEKIAGTAFSYDFDRGVNLEKITIPSSVKSIDTSSFSYTKAKEIVIEEGVLEIKRLAFYNSQLNKIYLPKSLTNIEFGILDTDFGQENLEIHCYKDSYACNYLEQNKPSGNVKIIYR